MPDEKIVHADLSDSTLDYFIEENLTEDKRSVEISGKKIRYTIQEEAPKKPFRRLQQNNWIYLPEDITLQIFPATNPSGDNDIFTLKQNCLLVEDSLREKIAKEEAAILAANNRKQKAEEALRILLLQKNKPA